MGNSASKLTVGSVAGAALSLTDGTLALGGTYIIIDSITWAPTASGNIALACAHVTAPASPATVWYATASAAGTYNFAFPGGFPVLASSIDCTNPGVTITLTGSANAGTATIAWHYRACNG